LSYEANQMRFLVEAADGARATIPFNRISNIQKPTRLAPAHPLVF